MGRCFKCGEVGHLAGACPLHPNGDDLREYKAPSPRHRAWVEPVAMEQLPIFRRTFTGCERKVTRAAIEARPKPSERAKSAMVRKAGGDVLVSWKLTGDKKIARKEIVLADLDKNRK